MAVFFSTKTPKRLLATYKKAIDEGRVKTWSYDDDGDFTHTAEQWRRKAWLRPKIRPREQLIFYIFSPADEELSTVLYAVYQGRIIESMLRHCDDLFESARASAAPVSGDSV